MKFPLNVLLSTYTALVLSGCATNDAYSVSRAYENGRWAARRDAAKGILAVERYGLPTPVSQEYERLLSERYGIETRRVGGCVVTSRINAHAVGYNEIAQPEIEGRFGKDVWNTTKAEARSLFSQNQVTQ